jgi:hypothetical protein
LFDRWYTFRHDERPWGTSTFHHTVKLQFAMHWRLPALTVALALAALGLGARGSLSAPLVQSALGKGAASPQRVDLRRTHNPLKHCFKRKGVQPCRAAGLAPNGPHAGFTASPGTLPLPSSLPPGAGFGRTYGNHRIEPKSAESQAGGSSSGLEFTGGIGVPTKRVTLEGALSPYQQPNGNTSAATPGRLTNGIEEQGMHFGLEWRY